MKCIVCTRQMSEVGDRFDDRYGYPGRYALHRCLACGHVQTAAIMSPEQISSLYTDYYPRSERSLDDWHPPTEETGLRAWWNGVRASAFRWVPPNVRVLDVGCGFGESLGYHRARGCDAHGVEADANILRVAERYGLNVRHGLFDASNYTPDSFDVVTLDQVIEHVAEPRVVLLGVHRVLRPGGTLVLSTPNANGWGAKLFGQRWIHWHAPYHLQFFSRASMTRTAEQTGFVVVSCYTVTNSAWLDYQWGHLVTYSAPGNPSPYWSTSTKRSMGQRVALKLLRFIDRTGLNALITRLMDGLGWGDNIVYVLTKRSEAG